MTTSPFGHRCILVMTCLALAPGPACAQPHARAGRTLQLAGTYGGVWITPRTIYGLDPAPLSACAREGACAPVVETAHCAPPTCPGDGYLHTVATDLARVATFPTDLGGYQAELEALRADPSLLELHHALAEHPDAWRHARDLEQERRRRAESPRWNSDYRENDRFETSVTADLASLTGEHGSYAGGTATFGLHFQLEANQSDETNEGETMFNAIVGDTFGFEVRAHFLHRLDTIETAPWMLLVGLALIAENRYAETVVRLPSVGGVVIPELGLAQRADRPTSFYAGWSLPLSFAFDHDVAMDVALRALVVVDWLLVSNADDEPAYGSDAIVMLSSGVRFR